MNKKKIESMCAVYLQNNSNSGKSFLASTNLVHTISCWLLLCVALVLVGASKHVFAAVGDVTTIAGTGLPSFSGDGKAANLAGLWAPRSVVLDEAGNIFIADTVNNRIRRISASTGLITTIAGTGEYGFSGDGGPATSASFKSPSGMALDAVGNIYIADTDNQRIRKITVATGVIATVAGSGSNGFSGDGSLATNAEIANPVAPAIDKTGNIYFLDNHSRVRKVTVATGIIDTVVNKAGYGSPLGDGGPAVAADLFNANGIAVDSTGNIYIADSGNRRVRKVDASTGIINTIAGTGADSYSGDGGRAVNARFYLPFGVTLDQAGNVYIVDSSASRIRKITAATGVIKTIAGIRGLGFSGDNGPATLAQFEIPTSVAVDKQGNVYIADSGNNRIRKITGPIADAALPANSDLSGDGKSDLTFRNAVSGQISSWIMSGSNVASNAGLVPPGNWTVTHTADFNGDGKADLLFRNEDGAVTLWLMNGLTVTSSAGLVGPDPNWRVSHVGDFNGDGKADILWRNTNGAVTLWLMNGTELINSVGLLAPNSDWSVSHVADFDGDDNADILWKNRNGAVTMWRMNGINVLGAVGLLGPDANWVVSHVADFNGDGNADILWRNINGAATMWLMDGYFAKTTTGLLGADANWRVSHVGDFSGDGKADLLWRNTNGAVTMWLMSGASVTSAISILGADPNWRVTHLADYNGDGKADLLWRNSVDGSITMWLMNGAAVTSAVGILGASPWAVVPPMP
jgi:FG-GAP-like repeat/NHL repeat